MARLSVYCDVLVSPMDVDLETRTDFVEDLRLVLLSGGDLIAQPTFQLDVCGVHRTGKRDFVLTGRDFTGQDKTQCLVVAVLVRYIETSTDAQHDVNCWYRGDDFEVSPGFQVFIRPVTWVLLVTHGVNDQYASASTFWLNTCSSKRFH